jgi:acid stress-induced BolA-like protein IbaG/YrbA
MKFHKLPLIARIVMKPALWGSGVKVDIVTFEGLTPGRTNLDEIEGAMSSALGSEWSWFIRSRSKKTQESAVIFVHGDGSHFDMMIVSAEQGEAAVVKVRLKADEMKKWMDDPDEMALHHGTEKPKEKHKAKQKDKDKTDADNVVLSSASEKTSESGSQ